MPAAAGPGRHPRPAAGPRPRPPLRGPPSPESPSHPHRPAAGPPSLGGMGIVHRATLTPSKPEIVEEWLPSRSWASGRTIAEKVAEYRFDDPEGEVGVETILWR